MNFQQAEKLKKLIQTSPVLNSAERDEWLILLDLMNEKQMQELEKILSSNQQINKSVNQQISRPASQSISKSAISSQPLSHIMNLPRISETPVMQKPHSSLAALPKKTSPGFFTRIKSILAEKELPAGLKKDELRLMPPPPHAHSQGGKLSLDSKSSRQIPKSPPVVPRPRPKAKAEIQPEKKFPQASKPEEGLGVENLFPHLRVFQSPPLAKESPPFKPGPLKEAPVKLADLLEKTKLQQAYRPAVSPHQPQFQEPAQKAVLGPDKKGLEKWPSLKGDLAKPQLKPEVKENNEIKQLTHQSLKDLAALTPEKFGEKNNNLVLSIRQLIKELGYYEVIFNLEKSPLFQTYIQTGLNILGGKANFENPGQSPDKHYLSRAQFEQFIDFLKQIQGE